MHLPIVCLLVGLIDCHCDVGHGLGGYHHLLLGLLEPGHLLPLLDQLLEEVPLLHLLEEKHLLLHLLLVLLLDQLLLVELLGGGPWDY